MLHQAFFNSHYISIMRELMEGTIGTMHHNNTIIKKSCIVQEGRGQRSARGC